MDLDFSFNKITEIGGITEAFNDMKKLKNCLLDVEYFDNFIIYRNTKLTHLPLDLFYNILNNLDLIEFKIWYS